MNRLLPFLFLLICSQAFAATSAVERARATISGPTKQLTSCPADIVAYVASLPVDSRVQFPSGCSYTLTTSSTVEIPNGVWIDFADTLITRTATAAAIVTMTNKDVTKSIHVSNLRCAGAFATQCIKVDQTGGNTGTKDAFVFKNIKASFLPDTTMTSCYGFKVDDTGVSIDGADIRITTADNATNAWAIRGPILNSTTDAAVDFVITNWTDHVECGSFKPTFCRGLDVSYQNASGGGPTFGVSGYVKDFTSYAHRGGQGEACKQTNDTSSGSYTNEVWWSNGSCDGSSIDFRDGSAFGQGITAHFSNVNMVNGTYSLKTTSTYDFSGSTYKTSNVWNMDASLVSDTNSDNNIEEFINNVMAVGDTLILPPASFSTDDPIDIAKAVNIKGAGGYSKGCATKITVTGTTTSAFSATVDNVSISDLCIVSTTNSITDGIVFNCTAGTTCINNSVKDVSVSLTGSTTASNGFSFQDSGGSVFNSYVSVNKSSTGSVTGGIYIQSANTSDLAVNLNVVNSEVFANTTGGTSRGFHAKDNGSSNAITFKIINSKFYSQETTSGTTYGVVVDGGDASGSIEDSTVFGSDSDVFLANSGTLQSNGGMVYTKGSFAGTAPTLNNPYAFALGFISPGPADQVIASTDTVTANACGTFKSISSAGAVTTNTTNTFTAPSTSNKSCCMFVVNTGANNITLDNNANFVSAGAADVVLGAGDTVHVCSSGSGGKWYQIGATGNN